MKETFRPCGEVVGVRLVKDRETGAGRGFGCEAASEAVTCYLCRNPSHMTPCQLLCGAQHAREGAGWLIERSLCVFD